MSHHVVLRESDTTTEGAITSSRLGDWESIEKILRCEICRDMMAFPFILDCGHTFCYSCIFEWTKTHRSCPRCRAKVRKRPVLVYALKEIFDIINNGNNVGKSISGPQNNEHYEEQLKMFNSHGQDLFPGIFRSSDSAAGSMMADTEDRVLRCSRCHWEVEGPECLHCGHTFSDYSLGSNETLPNLLHEELGSADESQDTQEGISNDSDNSIDSFIVPDGETETIGDAASSSSSISSSSSEGRELPPTRRIRERRNRTRIMISSDEEENSSANVILRSRNPRSGGVDRTTGLIHPAIIQISDDSDDGVENNVFSTHSVRVTISGHEEGQSSGMDDYVEEFYGFE